MSAAALDLTVPPASSTESSAPTGGPAPVPVDVWLDELGRVVTTTTTRTVAGQQVTSTNHGTGFNQPVTITAPDRADVATR
jgi:hypothetical protein